MSISTNTNNNTSVLKVENLCTALDLWVKNFKIYAKFKYNKNVSFFGLYPAAIPACPTPIIIVSQSFISKILSKAILKVLVR